MERGSRRSVEVRTCEDADIAAVTAIDAHHVVHASGTFEERPPEPRAMAHRRLQVRDANHLRDFALDRIITREEIAHIETGPMFEHVRGRATAAASSAMNVT